LANNNAKADAGEVTRLSNRLSKQQTQIEELKQLVLKELDRSQK